MTKTKQNARTFNAALAQAGYAERVVQGRGYVYFVDGNSHEWFSSSIPVCYMRDLTVERVLEWRRILAGDVR